MSQPENSGEFELTSDPSKYVTLPVQHEAIWKKYQITLDTFWTVYEINQLDLDNLSDASQRQYLLKIVAFMLIAHNTIVTKELFLDLINNIDIKEAAYYFGSQADSKKTHSLMYSLLLDELIKTDARDHDIIEKKAQLMNEIAHIPEVRDLLRWYVQNVNLEQESFARRMFAFATLQGVIFSSIFMLISWLEKQYPSKLNGLMKSNSLIWRDEKLNLSFSCMLFDYIDDQISSEEATNMINQVVNLAKNIFTKGLPVSKLGIDSESMSQFIEYLADSILADTKHGTIFNIEKTPFDWIVEPKIETNKQVDIPMVNTAARATFGLDEDF